MLRTHFWGELGSPSLPNSTCRTAVCSGCEVAEPTLQPPLVGLWQSSRGADGQSAVPKRPLHIYSKALGRNCTLLIVILRTFPNQMLRTNPGGRRFMVSLKETNSTSPAVLRCSQHWAITATGTHICPEGTAFSYGAAEQCCTG